MGAQTHKDRVNEFNSKLDKLSEHHDMPKVSSIVRVAADVRSVLDKARGAPDGLACRYTYQNDADVREDVAG